MRKRMSGTDEAARSARYRRPRAWFYVDAATFDEAKRTAEADGYTVSGVMPVGPLANGLNRYRVYAIEGRGV